MRGKTLARLAVMAVAALIVAAVPNAAHAAALGIIDEAKIGVLDHDIAIGGDHKECCVDINLEALFTSPDFLHVIWSPRPTLGVTINTRPGQATSYGYFGLTWEADFLHSSIIRNDGFFVALGLGGAVHDMADNTTDTSTSHIKGLGGRILFHEEFEGGYRINATYSISAFLDHISDANLTTHNPGLTNLGMRLGYKF
jgi:lipid A 3-O-deacylase